MPKLILLSVPTIEVKRLNKQVAAQDPEARECFLDLWRPYADQEKLYFLCETSVSNAPFQRAMAQLQRPVD